MFFAFEGLDDEAEQHSVERVLEGPDSNVVEAKARKRVEPVLQSLVGEVDSRLVIVFAVCSTREPRWWPAASKVCRTTYQRL